jgi:steroid 5-alpha reductase family enzyme
MHALFGNDIQLQQLAGTLIIIMLSSAALCFVVSELSQNYSQVDKLWSLMPVIYSFVTRAYFPSLRVWIMSILVTAWGLRLSYNFSRKGGYSIIPWRGEEDYRWAILRGNPMLRGRLRFGLFNLIFISLYQNFLILIFSSPLLMAAKHSDTRLNLLDAVAALLMILFLIAETIADNQLFVFQKMKKTAKKTAKKPQGLYAESIKKGFFSEGLWRYVRHPNFISEQLIWVSFYLFSVAASGIWLNWTITGAVLLILLFIGSSEMTEKISSSKYPGYSAYKKKVPRYFPRIFGSYGK